MTKVLKLTKEAVRKGMIQHQFGPYASQTEVYQKLRSVQFDPIQPVGCNHDLVFQARLPDYKIGDWQDHVYKDRFAYDGWDKQASLVPCSGWPLRRYIHKVHRRLFEEKIFMDHASAVEAVLKEITDHGPKMPKDFDFQQKKEEWKGSWFGPSVTKQVLRALWHSGIIMTLGRHKGQHIYDLTERVLPREYLTAGELDDKESVLQLTMERYKALGVIRVSAPPEIWSYAVLNYDRKWAHEELVNRGEIVPIDIEGVKAYVSPDFLTLLDRQEPEPICRFIAPLDQLMWDRKLIAHLFGFDYVWEIYTPEAKRKWGYYVLPVLNGDKFAAKVEFAARNRILEVRQWHWENAQVNREVTEALIQTQRAFMNYASCDSLSFADHIDPSVKDVFSAA